MTNATKEQLLALAEIPVGVCYRPGKPTIADYNEAITDLLAAKHQLQSGSLMGCAVCGDSGHAAQDGCHHDPLVLARRWAATTEVYQCWHCGFTATNAEEATEHFGKTEDEFAACLRARAALNQSPEPTVAPPVVSGDMVMVPAGDAWDALVAAAGAYADFVAAREAMNAVRPAVDATPAETALYHERWRVDNEAEREHFRTAIKLAHHAEAIIAASLEDGVAAAPKASPVEGDDILDLADKAVTWALDSFGGYCCDEVDAGIHYMQARGKDRWSMQAQMELEQCFGCEGSGFTYNDEPCPLCQPETDTALSTEAVPVEREQLAQIIARAYGGSLYLGLGELGDYPVDDEAYRAADAILALLGQSPGKVFPSARKNPSLGGGGR